MTDDPVEDLTYDFLEEKINAAAAGDVLFEQELHDTLHKKIDKDSGIRISDAESDFAPNGEGEMQEYDALITLVCYSRIEGADKTERRAARKKAFLISKAVAQLFENDRKMGGRVCKARILSAVRGWDSINSKPYAVVNMPIVFNESGEINFERRRTY